MDNLLLNNLNSNNIMKLNGKGQVSVIPDIASIRLGVETTGYNLQKVQEENAKASLAVQQILKQFGIQEIKTIQYTIDKLYAYENDKRVDKGYSVRNIVEIKTKDMKQIGALIDAAVNNGANVIEGISFEVSNLDFYYQQALNMAVDDAIQKAESIGKQLKTAINPVPRQIVENSVQPIPYQAVYSLREGVSTTPIEPGQNQIQASVTVDFEYY